MRQRSIARRLIASVLAIQMVSAAGVVLAALAYERHTRLQAFDVMLRGRADSMLGAVQDADDEADNIMLDRTGLQLQPGDLYEVQEASGRILGRSDNWTGPAADLRKQREDGVFNASLAHVSYRLIRLGRVRIVDPGKASGGVVHPVTIWYGSPTAGVWHEIRRTVVFYAAASCFLLVFTGSLVMWLLYRGLLPLRHLAAEAEGISADRWSFHASETARTTKELAPLATALSSAVKRLELSFQQQRHFVSDAAHELKTSVAVLKSSLQLLSMRQRSAEEYEVGLNRSLTDCERMEDIVAKMLTLARFDDRRSVRYGERADLRNCAATAIDQLRPVAEQTRIVLALSADGPVDVPLSADEATLLCSNLLMNAVQHSTSASTVEVSIQPIGADTVELRVSDYGHGIDPEILPHVFERFYRADPSRTRKSGGTGLGLAICRAIAQSAAGDIRLESAPASGTTAVVRLPRAERPIVPPLDPRANDASSACVNQPVEH